MAVTQQTWLQELQALVTNTVDLHALRGRRIAAILGDVPSTYAKSPRLWNAAFLALGLNATYIPLDVPHNRLRDVLQALRASDEFLGGSVTVPYKSEIIPLLDEVDPFTARIGAVNVIVRTTDGRLVGHNTDGQAGVRVLTDTVIPSVSPLLEDLRQARVLLIGAGGAAQALAISLWQRLLDGELVIANRTGTSAETLIQRLAMMRAGHLVAIEESAMASRAPSMDLVINATVKGQAGIRKLPDGRWTTLEAYSALGPAHPAALVPSSRAGESEEAFWEAWYPQSVADIQRNHAVSFQICARLPRHTRCYDIIYAPVETTFLRHARWSGHATLNGKAMNVAQAVEAFMRYVCCGWLAQLGRNRDEVYPQVVRAMAEEWGK